MTGTYLIPLALPFELGPWGQLYFILLCLGMFYTKFHCSRRWITVLVTNIIEEPRLHLPVNLSHVWEDKQTLLKRRKKGGHWALEGQGASQGHIEKSFSLCQKNPDTLVAGWAIATTSRRWWSLCPGGWLKPLRRRGPPLDISINWKEMFFCT